MSLPPKLPRKIPGNDDIAEITPPNQQYKCMVSFIEPLAFLQFKAEQYKYAKLSKRLQHCVDELYSMLEAHKFYN